MLRVVELRLFEAPFFLALEAAREWITTCVA